ncbi:MAG: hypothetical protein P4L77_16630 [Sulfuriferula sp.]|nr:hypothetical protein [Sulfuriferula sp.]
MPRPRQILGQRSVVDGSAYRRQPVRRRNARGEFRPALKIFAVGNAPDNVASLALHKTRDMLADQNGGCLPYKGKYRLIQFICADIRYFTIFGSIHVEAQLYKPGHHLHCLQSFFGMLFATALCHRTSIST